MLNNYICAVDIGSSKISASIARINRKRITSIFFETIDSVGVEQGSIVNSIELVRCIERLLKKLKTKSGVNIKVLCANISGQDMIIKHSHAILPLAERGNKVITLSDIQKVNNQARILGSNLEEEIIHQIPFNYMVDSKSGILQPLGLYGHRLEADLYLVCAKTSMVQNLARVINQAGYEIKNISFSGIAASRTVFGKKIKEGINILCDMGSDITELLIFKDGALRDIQILPFGGKDFTLDISKTLKIPFSLAEDVKRTHSLVGDYGAILEDKEILIKMDNAYIPIKQKFLSELLTSKAKLICQTIKETVEKTVICSHVNNFEAAGRSVLLEGFLETLENTLGIPVKLGRIIDPDIIPLVNKNDEMSGQKYLNYITALGLICEFLPDEEAIFLPKKQHPGNLFLKTVNKVKEVYQEYF